MTRRATGKDGYFGIAIDNGKNPENRGTIWRTAYNFGAAFTAQIGGRYARQSSDTVKTYAYVPHFTYVDPDEWYANLPYSCVPVAVEISDDSESLYNYKHPNQAVYIVGPEDGSIRKQVVENCRDVVTIPSYLCLNQSIAAATVMYDRNCKIALEA